MIIENDKNALEKEITNTDKDSSMESGKDFEIEYPEEYSDKVVVNFPDEYEEVEYEKNMKQNPNINEYGERIGASLQERAILDLKINEENKAEIYEEVFDSAKIQDKELEKDVLILLREKLSTQTVGKYKIIYIKKSPYNSNFKTLVEKIISMNFSEKNEAKVIKSINNFILAFAVYKYVDLDKEQKSKVKLIVIKKLHSLKKVLKQSIRDKKFSKEKIIITETKTKEDQTQDSISNEKVEPVNKNPVIEASPSKEKEDTIT
jgi:hypothetical protein